MYRLFTCLMLLFLTSLANASEPIAAWPHKTYYRSIEIDGQHTFYREAGDASRPTLLLLHGFPSSSHTYRELIPLLSGHYHIIAPDYLGSGYSAPLAPQQAPYTFDRLAEHIAAFTERLGLRQYSLYIQDFGAPVGFRLMQLQPERLQALVVQNANAYLQGLTPTRLTFFEQAHRDRSAANLLRLYGLTTAEGVINQQYLRDVAMHPERISPDAWTHDLLTLAEPSRQQAQVQLFQDYWKSIEAYPQWQAFLRKRQPPTLVVWGQNDPAFVSDGALAYRQDLPAAQIHLIDAGHFAVEEQPVVIAQHVVGFMQGLEQQGHLATTSNTPDAITGVP
ncbi:alpha/beta hydrolase [Pseudomonas sp.]|uniref:alpha/beta fold hydrolase n=1 Tax=Pseudomonas sp. TaxID=306 RepID=UPI001B1ADCCD|nr:alpha/beta hydrolase [Pseudomonas sp.]MBO9551807.1 alpha/beta hydrolase [Pseudomonas sp.]